MRRPAHTVSCHNQSSWHNTQVQDRTAMRHTPQLAPCPLRYIHPNARIWQCVCCRPTAGQTQRHRRAARRRPRQCLGRAAHTLPAQHTLGEGGSPPASIPSARAEPAYEPHAHGRCALAARTHMQHNHARAVGSRLHHRERSDSGRGLAPPRSMCQLGAQRGTRPRAGDAAVERRAVTQLRAHRRNSHPGARNRRAASCCSRVAFGRAAGTSNKRVGTMYGWGRIAHGAHGLRSAPRPGARLHRPLGRLRHQQHHVVMEQGAIVRLGERCRRRHSPSMPAPWRCWGSTRLLSAL